VKTKLEAIRQQPLPSPPICVGTPGLMEATSNSGAGAKLHAQRQIRENEPMIRQAGRLRQVIFCACMLAWSRAAMAQAAPEREPAAIFEIGGAGSQSIRRAAGSYGPDLAIEFTPIEKWLEIEAGVTPLFSRNHSVEWNYDVLFKKPWNLSKKVEFMLGFGPEFAHSRESGRGMNSIAAEIAGDFMFWPGTRRRFGWFLEPAYEYSFAGGHEKSLGMSAGLLIAIQ